jgi:hypothetical protein
MRWTGRGLFALSIFAAVLSGAVAPSYELALSAARRQATSSVATVARVLPRSTGYHVEPCVRVNHLQVDCPYQVLIQAMSVGTITCSSTVWVYATVSTVNHGGRAAQQVELSTAFAGRPKCVRKLPPQHYGVAESRGR